LQFWLELEHFVRQSNQILAAATDDMLLDDSSAAVATVCFRVAQEAITNVVRHAGARNMWIELDRGERDLRLVVRDDGCGFDVAARRRDALRGSSMGLLSMEERVVLAGGEFEVVSQTGRGTEVRVRLPMDIGPTITREIAS